MYEGPTTVDANESKPSNPGNVLAAITVVVVAFMLLTGHFPAF